MRRRNKDVAKRSAREGAFFMLHNPGQAIIDLQRLYETHRSWLATQ